MIKQLLRHGARTYVPEEASLFIVPVFPHVSHTVQSCHGTDHPRRMQSAVDALKQSPHFARNGGRDHLIVCNSFRIASLGPMRELLQNGTVAWFEDPRSVKKHEGPNHLYSMATWRCTVVVPYQANPICRTMSATWSAPVRNATSSIFFQGSLDAGRGVRIHVAKLSTYPGADIANSSRTNIIAVARSNDMPSGSRFTPLGTAVGMLRSNFCLVPKGDTPTSSRIYSAVACGCVPIIISNEFKSHQPFPHVLAPNKHFWNLGVPINRSNEGVDPNVVPRPIWIMEAPFMGEPAKQLDIKLLGPGGLTAHLPALRDTLRQIAPDILYDVEGSRVGHNMLMEWKMACSGDPLPPLFAPAGGKSTGSKGPGKGPGAKGPGKGPGAKGPGKGPGAKGPGKGPGAKGLGKGPGAKGPGKGPGAKGAGGRGKAKGTGLNIRARALRSSQ